MDKILVLDYERFLCGFYPQTTEDDAGVLSEFNQQLGLELTKKEGLYRYSISAPGDFRDLRVHIAYKVSKGISNLVNETTSLLEDTAKKSGLKGKSYFALESSRFLPLETYEAEAHKQIIDSLFKQIGISH